MDKNEEKTGEIVLYQPEALTTRFRKKLKKRTTRIFCMLMA